MPSCRFPVHVFAYSCAPPPTAVPAPIHLQSLATIASEERIRQVQKRLSIKEKSQQISYSRIALLSESIVVLHRSRKFLFLALRGGGATFSCERELACSCFASPQYTIPVLPSSPSALSTSGGPLLFVNWWPKWSGGTEGHFGCKWLPWGSPARAPLATPVALPRAFMPVSSPRIRVQLCTSAYSCISSDSSPKSGCHREREAHPSGTKAIKH